MRYRVIRPWKRKFRGARRYYDALNRRAAEYSLDLGDDNWFDLHHTHFDWPAHGRRSPKHRRQHLAALFTAFRRALEQARASGRPVQVWVNIAPDTEPEQDALYVHSPNPEGTPFPYAFAGVEWDAAVPAILREFVVDPSWEVGRIHFEGQQWYNVREKPTTGVVTPARADTAG